MTKPETKWDLIRKIQEAEFVYNQLLKEAKTKGVGVEVEVCERSNVVSIETTVSFSFQEGTKSDEAETY